MSEYPHFYKVNQLIKDQDAFASDSAIGLVENIADYNRSTVWESIGSNDAVTELITVEFNAPDGQNENRDIDTFILTGFNGKDFRIYYGFWNGSSFDSWINPITVTNNDKENLIISMSSVSAGRIGIQIDNTIVADEEKTISEFVATELIWEATMPMDKFSIKNKQKLITRRLYNGTGQAISQYDKFASKIDFMQISGIERNELRSIYDLHTSFIVILEPYDYLGDYDKPQDFYRVLWMNAWEQKYFTKIKGAGYNVKLSIEEV